MRGKSEDALDRGIKSMLDLYQFTIVPAGH
jgi:hypothetical protein